MGFTICTPVVFIGIVHQKNIGHIGVDISMSTVIWMLRSLFIMNFFSLSKGKTIL